MPWLTAVTCTVTESHPCGEPQDYARESYCHPSGCPRPSVESVHEWQNGIKETRWVSPSEDICRGFSCRVSLSLFEVGNKRLRYWAMAGDVQPDKFLDSFAQTLRPE